MAGHVQQLRLLLSLLEMMDWIVQPGVLLPLPGFSVKLWMNSSLVQAPPVRLKIFKTYMEKVIEGFGVEKLHGLEESPRVPDNITILPAQAPPHPMAPVYSISLHVNNNAQRAARFYRLLKQAVLQ